MLAPSRGARLAVLRPGDAESRRSSAELRTGALQAAARLVRTLRETYAPVMRKAKIAAQTMWILGDPKFLRYALWADVAVDESDSLPPLRGWFPGGAQVIVRAERVDAATLAAEAATAT